MTTLDTLRVAGLAVRADGGELVIRGPLSDELKTLAQANKPQILADLAEEADRPGAALYPLRLGGQRGGHPMTKVDPYTPPFTHAPRIGGAWQAVRLALADGKWHVRRSLPCGDVAPEDEGQPDPRCLARGGC